MRSVITALLLSVFIAIPVFAASKTAKDDVDLIENAIIIDGLSLTSDKPGTDETPKNGSITYDDSFDDEISAVEMKSGKHDRTLSKKDIITALRKKDERWHYTKYVVKKGDSLWEIAHKFGINHRMIIKANDITGPENIRVGKSLEIPNKNGVFYKVKRGDNLEKISTLSKVSVAVITDQNPGSSRMIKTGEKIFIPDTKMNLNPPVREKIVKRADKDDNREKRDSDEKDDQRVALKSPTRTQRVAKSNFIWPLRGRITSGFGTRTDPFSRTKKFHNGLDISAELNTPVKAAADGTVIFAGWKDGYGNLVVMRHAGGYISVYGHNSSLKFEEGAEVKKGQIIALSGMTGAVTGAHLHFEIQRYQTPLNPLRMMK